MVMFFFQSISVYVLFHASFFFISCTNSTNTFVSLSLSPSETPAVSVSRCPGGRRGSWAGCYCWTAVAVSQKQTLCATHQQQSIDRKTSQHVRTETPGSSEPLRSDQHVKLPLPIDRFNVPECRRSGSR